MTKEDIIQHFNMTVHPEGGAFYESYRSSESFVPAGFNGERNYCTEIYFLLGHGEVSKFHRIKSDETWHFYLGGPLNVVEITPDGKLIETTLGQDILNAQHLQYTVKAGHWFGAYPLEHTDFSLVACTVAPAFDFSDFELANKEKLIKQFPEFTDIIAKLS